MVNTKKTKSFEWIKTVSRPYYLLLAYYTQIAYSDISGFSIKNALIVGKNGMTDKYVPKEELEGLYNFIRTNKNLAAEIKKALDLDKELKEFIKNSSIKDFLEFHKKYLKAWSYNVLAYYAGHALDDEQIKPIKKDIEYLRGFDSAMSKIENKFLPRLLKELEEKTKIASDLLAYSTPEELINNKFDVSALEKRKEYFVLLIKNGKILLYTGDRAREIEENELFDVKDKIKSIKWEKWLHRPQFQAFILSFSKEAGTRKYFDMIGIKGGSMKAALFQNRYWYFNEEILRDMYDSFEEYFKKNTIFDLTKSLEKFHDSKKKRIFQLIKSKESLKDKLNELKDIFTCCLTFVWSTHGLEVYYEKKAREEVPKHFKGNVESFIGDASFPKKKTAHALMEDAIRGGVKPEIIAKKYGWLRVRDVDSEPFSTEDIKNLAKELKPAEKHKKIEIPKELKKLFSEMQELVYYRTARTDVLYELLFLARPILKEACKYYNIEFKDLKNYPIDTIVDGKPIKYGENPSFAVYEERAIFSNDAIISEEGFEQSDSVKGTIAFKGFVKGYAKIVHFVSELDKVKKGDILVTQMTFPSFIAAMNRASAFVTDEGGITCHAAIVAREMKKPCITGTKIATKIFKDNDLIEVDANKGMVRKIK
jgi:phosphohistidine swiveling domain-containing protein